MCGSVPETGDEEAVGAAFFRKGPGQDTERASIIRDQTARELARSNRIDDDFGTCRKEGIDDLLALLRFERANRIDQPAAGPEPRRGACKHRLLPFGQFGN